MLEVANEKQNDYSETVKLFKEIVKTDKKLVKEKTFKLLIKAFTT